MNEFKMTIENPLNIQKLRDDGILVIADFLDELEIRRTRAECDFLRTQEAVIDRPGASKVGFSTPRIVKCGLINRARMLGKIAKNKRMAETATEYFGEPSTICNVASIINTPSQDFYDPEQWHCDASQVSTNRADIRTLKFHIYLNDVDRSNGAFAYVPRTHSLVAEVRQRMTADELPRKPIFVVQDMLDLQTELQDVLSKTGLEILRDLREVFSGGADVVDKFYICGKAGTAIVFDDFGIHKGGEVEQGERVLVRYDLMTNRIRDSRLSRKELYIRHLLNKTLPHPIRNII